MPPSIHHAILKEQHRMTTNVHNNHLEDNDDDLPADMSSYRREESTSSTSLPPAFNPEFIVGASSAKASTSAMAPVTIQTAEEWKEGEEAINTTTTTVLGSVPVIAETVDPFIAAVFQCGFAAIDPIVIDDRDDDNTLDFRPRLCLDNKDDDIMTARTVVSPNDRLEKRFVQEPRRNKADSSSSTSRVVDDDDDDDTKTTTTVTAATESSTNGTTTTRTNNTSSTSTSSTSSATLVPPLVPAVTGYDVPPPPSRDGTKANPPSAPRFISLTRHNQSHYYYDRLKPYAQVLAWRTQQYTRAALTRSIRMKQKHGPTVKRVAKKSWKVLRKVSQKSIAFCGHHGPIVGRKIQRASLVGVATLKEMEANHQILAKSKSGIYNAWSRQRGTRASF